MNHRAKDFIKTHEGLIWAVVEAGIEEDRILSFLRYVPTEHSHRKISTEDANRYLIQLYPHYLFHSQKKQAHLHGIPFNAIAHVYSARERIKELLNSKPVDEIEINLQKLIALLIENEIDLNHLGVTGSLLIGAQNAGSDIDIVVYKRPTFFKLQNRLRILIEKEQLQELDEAQWQDAFMRRGCSLSFKDYVRHEKRKLNKGMIQGTKFDLSLVEETRIRADKTWKKKGPIKIEAKITEDLYAFDHPGRYSIDHGEIKEILTFTHTYVGQAFKGETIEAAGHVEESEDGFQRLIIGSTREAEGEYIRVLWDRY